MVSMDLPAVATMVDLLVVITDGRNSVALPTVEVTVRVLEAGVEAEEDILEDVVVAVSK